MGLILALRVGPLLTFSLTFVACFLSVGPLGFSCTGSFFGAPLEFCIWSCTAAVAEAPTFCFTFSRIGLIAF